MASIIDYDQVLAKLTADGLVCNYYNGGAFAFPKSAGSDYHGWATSEDASIRAEARSKMTILTPPAVDTLLAGLESICRRHLGGPVWVMPTSHWAFELDFGSRAWLPIALEGVGVRWQDLAGLPRASAIAFDENEISAMIGFVEVLLQHLEGSDFMLAFPGRPALCMVHHHQQLWWMSTNADILEAVRRFGVARASSQ